MGFVKGTRPQFSQETANLLRSRLLAATLVLSIAQALGLISDFFPEFAPLVGLRALILAVCVVGFFALRSSRKFSLLQLRCFEGGLFGALVVELLLMMGGRLTAFAKVEDTVSLVAAQHVDVAAAGVRSPPPRTSAARRRSSRWWTGRSRRSGESTSS